MKHIRQQYYYKLISYVFVNILNVTLLSSKLFVVGADNDTIWSGSILSRLLNWRHKADICGLHALTCARMCQQSWADLPGLSQKRTWTRESGFHLAASGVARFTIFPALTSLMGFILGLAPSEAELPANNQFVLIAIEIVCRLLFVHLERDVAINTGQRLKACNAQISN